MTTIPSTKLAAEAAYKMAGVTAKDIDFAEVHDCFTIAEVVDTEDLGFFEKGQGILRPTVIPLDAIGTDMAI